MLNSLLVPAALLIGLLLFLFGMHQLESGIRALGYATFKRWLSRSTASPVGSAALGVGVTAILQSSSMVSLLVLAFASAGVLPLYNAVGIILGANLGTTVTGWMVATIGFKLSLQTLALPLMAAGAGAQMLPRQGERGRGLGVLLFGLGLIIFGLDTMKEAVAELPAQWDISALRGHSVIVYFLAGTGIAALIQSSSATMMITLAALHAGLIQLDAAAALVIGADLGTTSTTVLGSIGGSAVKRRLALAHLLFNLAVDLAALLFLLPLLPALLDLLGLADPLYSLVTFHSVFNLIGLVLFLPLLRPFSDWLAQRFSTGEEHERPLVGQPTSVPDAALVATAAVLGEMRLNAVVLNLHAFQLPPENLQLGGELGEALQGVFAQHLDAEQRYQRIKRQESDLLAYSFDLQEQPLGAPQVALLGRQTREARALVYSSKTLNDIRENLVALRHSDPPEVQALYRQHRQFVAHLYRRYLPAAQSIASGGEDAVTLNALLEDNERHYQQANEAVHDMAGQDTVSGIQLSTMLNVNREIHHALKDLLQALQG
ncbi:Na/Pi cotransporter family protein [Mangrovimicrobium sediminis]|uniref:Na/Pi cotransporter family protein n=1 Tax=Mangrovimicrobium sediminis TaxID=2562682 RepID=A0A4Z0M192_9GAMM|nr:Na/Pi symporter [Haliea sp. SAOS-164]TGD73311.1 Na/Pi cotransporter family protein [Haliea sp. SAOS-164]